MGAQMDEFCHSPKVKSAPPLVNPAAQSHWAVTVLFNGFLLDHIALVGIDRSGAALRNIAMNRTPQTGSGPSRAERRRAAKLAGKTGAAPARKPETAANLKAEIETHYRAGDLPKARRLTEKLLKAQPDDAATLNFSGMLAQQTGDIDTAIMRFSAAHSRQPSASTTKVLAEALRASIHERLNENRTDTVPEKCDRLQSLQPHSTEAPAFKAIALLHLGERALAADALGIEQLVEISDLAAPSGWERIDAFNTDLAREISSDPSMAVPDEAHPTYHNRHLKITAPLVIDRPGPVAALTRMIEETVAGYRAQREGLSHSFLSHWPQSSKLEAWGTLLEGEGTVDSHIHLEGYLGMVYYPELPPEVSEGQGWLELGRPPDDFPIEVEPITQLIEPKPGRLVIFPGYLFHRTTPFKSTHRRISIAYDVVAT